MEVLYYCWLPAGKRLELGVGGGRERLNVLGAFCPEDHEYLDRRYAGKKPNLNLIERLWKFLRKEALRTWHESFEEMREAVAGVLDNVGDYAGQVRTPMTEKFHPTPEMPTLVVGQARP